MTNDAVEQIIELAKSEQALKNRILRAASEPSDVYYTVDHESKMVRRVAEAAPVTSVHCPLNGGALASCQRIRAGLPTGHRADDRRRNCYPTRAPTKTPRELKSTTAPPRSSCSCKTSAATTGP